ncbi:MAG: PDZ domain-containing protein [Planctomycetota bacterium]|jgi:S1-C subfamily serine protease
MKRNFCFNLAVLLATAAVSNCFAGTLDLSEPMKESLVYLDISSSSYDLSQPWNPLPISKKSGYGCAVGPYEVLTIAENVADAAYVQTRRYGQNAYIPATVKIVDYEYNLCLLELDKSAMDKPLTPLSFIESFPKGEQLTAYWLSSGNHLTTSQATLDRAEMSRSLVSFVSTLTFFATNVSRPFGDGQVCCHESDPIGIAAWGSETDVGIIPAETINRFLSHCKKEGYSGFSSSGFRASALLDPARRKYLNVPDDIKHGMYISDVYTIGTGCKELQLGDVILSIDGKQLNPYGRYEHPEYKRISFSHILSQIPDGTQIPFQIIRNGEIMALEITGSNVASDNMLVPYYLYDKQPEYFVTGGYIFQRLNRDYLGMWGNEMSGNAPPHLYHYQKDFSYKPTQEREDIVILSYVMPAEINLGYQQLSHLVVDSVNGMKIASMKHFADTVTAADNGDVLEITFEMDSPVLIIPKSQLTSANAQISRLYGISKMMHLGE